MYVNIKYLKNLKFNNCQDCTKCCENKMFAPLILDDIKKVYKPKLLFKKQIFMIII
jgi:hypothetical protein